MAKYFHVSTCYQCHRARETSELRAGVVAGYMTGQFCECKVKDPHTSHSLLRIWEEGDPPIMYEIPWGKFCDWVQGKTVVKQSTGDEETVLLEFSDGTRAEIHSEYEEDFSDETPGDGIQPPTVHIAEPRTLGQKTPG